MTEKYDIAVFILRKGKATWTDLENYFVKGPKERHIARQTLSNWLKELIREGLVRKQIDEKTLGPIYIVPEDSAKRIFLDIAEKIRKMENKQKILLGKIKELKFTAKSLSDVTKEYEELHNRALIRLSKYLFGLESEQIARYLEEFHKEVEKAHSRIYDEMVEKGPKLSDEEWDKWWNQAWDKFYERYIGIDSFIIWLIEKKGLKPKV